MDLSLYQILAAAGLLTVLVVGVGVMIAAARKPKIVERKRPVGRYRASKGE